MRVQKVGAGNFALEAAVLLFKAGSMSEVPNLN